MWRGVKRCASGGRWFAQSRHPAVGYLGTFATPEEAARAFDAAVFRATGDPNNLNFPGEYETATVELQCLKCGQHKNVTEFRFARGPRTVTSKSCRLCRRSRDACRDAETRKATGVSRTTLFRRRSPETGAAWLVRSAKRRSVKKGIAFDLDTEFVLNMFRTQGGRCAWTGRPMQFAPARADAWAAVSIDRLAVNGGYTRGNVQLVCYGVNRARHVLSAEDFVAMCRDVVATHGG